MSRDNNNYRNEEQDRRLIEIEKSVKVINGELGSVKTDVAQIKTDVQYLKKMTWFILLAIVGTAFASLTSIF